jgi:hypothetical protein
MTGFDGRYEIVAPEGEYTVIPNRFGYEFSPATRSVSLHANASEVDFTASVAVAPSYSISGAVLANEVGVPDVRLTLLMPSGLSSVASTLGDGTYSFTVQEGPGIYMLTPSNYPVGTQYSFSPPFAEIFMMESNPSVIQNFVATPL